jgi:LysM repeat protein
MTCINYNDPQFQKLEGAYGRPLAESIVRDYSRTIKGLEDDFYYPSDQEISTYFYNNRKKALDRTKEALRINPYLDELALRRHLKGVVSRFQGNLMVTRGWGEGSLVGQQETRRLIYEPNLSVMNELIEEFPEIFSMEQSPGNTNTTFVKITPLTERHVQQDVDQYAEELYWRVMTMDPKEIDAVKARTIAKALGDKFAAAFNMDYELVGEQEATEILRRSETPYDGQAAFFFNNTIYFVEGNLSIDNVLHEYGHPLIKSIAKKNRKLFDNLYTQLSLTLDGAGIIEEIKTKYPELSEDSDRFKEEALVTALEVAASKKVKDKVKDEDGFFDFIKKLLYAIKQVLRGLSKKVTLAKLDENTTLEQLANMMVSEDFVIQDLSFDKTDFAEFKKIAKQQWEKLSEQLKFDTHNESLQKAINRTYSENLDEIATLRNTPWRLREELNSGRDILMNIKDYLKDYQTINKPAEEDLVKAMDVQQKEFKERSIAFVNSLTEIKVFAGQIENIVKTMKSKKNYLTQDGISKIIYYREFLQRHALFLNDIKDVIDLNTENELMQYIIGTEGLVSSALKVTNDLIKDFTVEFFTEHTEFMGEQVEKYATDRVTQMLKQDGFTQDEIDKVINKMIENRERTLTPEGLGLSRTPKNFKFIKEVADEYYEKRLNRETIQDFIEGRRGDIGIFTAMITPYMNMNDPLAGGFVRFIKTQLSETESRSYQQANDIARNLLPLLKAVGYNPNNTKQLADMLLFVDKVPTQNEDGSFDEFEVYTFLNRFKDYRAARGKLQYDFDKAKTDGNREAMRAASRALWQFDHDYMHRPYKKEYYDIQKIWQTSNIVEHPVTGELMTVSAEDSQDAWLERQQALSTMNTYKNVHMTDIEDNYDYTEYDAAQANYNDLYNIYTKDGKIKDSQELGKVLVRLKYKDAARKFKEFRTNDKKVQREFEIFVKTKMSAANINMEEDSTAFDEQIQKFVDRNFVIAYSDEYYADLNRIYKTLNEIADRNKDKSPNSARLASLYNQRRILISQARDHNRIPDGQKLSPNQIKLLHNIEEEIIELNEEFDKKTGLTPEQKNTLYKYEKKLKKKQALTPEEKTEYTTLVNIKGELGMSQEDINAQRAAYQELSEIMDKVATESYIDAFNMATRNVDYPSLEVEAMTPQNATEWINKDSYLDAIVKDEDAKEWFLKNHVQRMRWDPEAEDAGGAYVLMWERIGAWSVTVPQDPAHYKKTTLTHPITGKPFEVNGVPNSKYTYTRVKDQYHSIPPGANKEDYVGTIIDNQFNYLPRRYEPGNPESAVDDKFINKEYEKLEKLDNAQFKLLEAIKKEVLEIQKNKPRRSKLYLDLARFRQRANLEVLQSGKAKEDLSTKLSTIGSVVKAMVKKDAADFEEDHNFKLEQQLVPTDMQGNPIDRVPVRGLYKLKKNDVSTDVLGSIYNYLHSINEQETLLELEPIAKSIRKTLTENADTAIKDTSKISSTMSRIGIGQSFVNVKENRRADAINYFIEKVFYGQANTKFQHENPMAVKVANMLMGNASRAFIALDLTSAMKNRYGMMFQSMIESAGGKYVTPKSLAEGRIWSMKAVGELITTGVYSRGPKSLMLQMMEIFDPITGKTKKDFGKSSSRTFMKDFMDATWMYDFRRLTDLEAGLQVFGGMMYKQYVDQKLSDGSVRSIKYIDAWELNEDQQMVLKEGIDPEWSNVRVRHVYNEGDTWESIAKQYNVPVEELKKKNKVALKDLEFGDEVVIADAKKFNDFKLKVQGVGKRLNGQMDEFDDAQANKYLGYRLFTFYKRYAVPMFLNRFQYGSSQSKNPLKGMHAYDWNMGELTKGYYITGLQAMKKVLIDSEKYWPLMTKEEKIAIRKMAAEGMMLAMLALIVTFLFGYDPGDEDRFEKMREREEEWGALGYMANHLLYQFIAVKTENEAFVPLPGVGLADWMEFTNNTTIAFGPTLGNYAKIINDFRLMAFGSEKAVYSQDAGPYAWQKEGKYKLWNHIGSLFGVKGKNYSPITAIKKFEIFENSKLQ